MEQEQNSAVEEPVAEIIQPDDEVLEQNIGAEEPVCENDPNDNDVDPGNRTLHLTTEIVSEMPGFGDNYLILFFLYFLFHGGLCVSNFFHSFT